MAKRFVSIWFCHLLTDWTVRRRPELQNIPFVFVTSEHGRMMVIAASTTAALQGITVNMRVADAKAIVPSLKVLDHKEGLEIKLLKAFGEWCIRFTPIVAIDPPDGLILDVTGCAHLWGGEQAYLQEIVAKLTAAGYTVSAGMADTIGAAWAAARYKGIANIIASGDQMAALLPLHPSALRLPSETLLRLQKLGFIKIASFANMPRSVLRRRFGDILLTKLSQALGQEEEFIQPLYIPAPYEERLTCTEPIRTATGIEIAIQQLLETLCKRLEKEGKGLRTAVLKCYRIDGKIVQAAIGTTRASHHAAHLYKLFELKISTIEPALGIELFVLEAQKTEDVAQQQEKLWAQTPGLEDKVVAELLDRLAGKVGEAAIRRFLPDEHYWPERSLKQASSIHEVPATEWRLHRPRPIMLLPTPESIDVTAPIPDYPPMLFRYRGKLHQVKKADGPERIEREWWLDGGEHRDYYTVEDESGQRYWLFRSGHYNEDMRHQWFIHGFFA